MEDVFDRDEMRRAREVLRAVPVPARPHVVAELQQMLQRGEPAMRDVSTLVETDPALAASVLRLVNAPVFGVRQQVHSLQQAIALLGFEQFYALVVTTALQRSFDDMDLGQGIFWRHNFNCGRLMRHLDERFLVASRTGGIGIDGLYLAGLFHDVSIPAIARRFPSYLRFYPMLAEAWDRIIDDEFQELGGTYHHAVSGLLAHSWGLGDDLCHVILAHHDPLLDLAGSAMRQAAALLQLCDYAELCYEHSIGMLPSAPLPPDAWCDRHSRAATCLDLDEEDLQDLLDEVFEFLGS